MVVTAEVQGPVIKDEAQDPADGDPRPQRVLSFWLDEVGPERWYAQDEALDERVRESFAEMWEHARDGSLSLWLTYPTGALAYAILTDQFPRNMWRGQAKSFATDRAALAAVKAAINQGWDMRVEEPARQFFYTPLMHSECQPDQERCVRLMATRLPRTGAGNLRHARAHREVIRRFGRFPTRNAALGRANRTCEGEYLADGGYGAVVRTVET